jgi:putative GTP pyrophosphokinase
MTTKPQTEHMRQPVSDLDEKTFLRTYGLDHDALTRASLQWNQLVEIYKDHSGNVPTLVTTATYITDTLRQVREVHSLKYRIKDPEHLLEKIVRKQLEDASVDIRPENYRDKVTDLIGVRALHLFKKDWIPVHDFITNTWELKEKPTANIRKGDSDEMTQQFTALGCEIKEHKAGYRSVHYLVTSQPTKDRVVTEVQVRTIFEEGWSEIDHLMRYPHNLDNVILSAFLDLFNRLSGSADEMGSFINLLKDALEARDEQHSATVKELRGKIKALQIDASKKQDLQNQVDQLRYPFANAASLAMEAISKSLSGDISKTLESINAARMAAISQQLSAIRVNQPVHRPSAKPLDPAVSKQIATQGEQWKAAAKAPAQPSQDKEEKPGKDSQWKAAAKTPAQPLRDKEQKPRKGSQKADTKNGAGKEKSRKVSKKK